MAIGSCPIDVMSNISISIHVNGASPVLQIVMLLFQEVSLLATSLTGCSTSAILASILVRGRPEIADAFSNLRSYWTPRPPLVKLHQVEAFFNIQSEIIKVTLTLSIEHS